MSLQIIKRMAVIFQSAVPVGGSGSIENDQAGRGFMQGKVETLFRITRLDCDTEAIG